MEDNYDISELLSEYDKMDDASLAIVVQRCESTDAGKAVVENNPDKKVYAVAKPTHQEYLQRLEAILKLTDGQDAEFFRKYLRYVLPIIKLSLCLNLYCINGAITYEAALDLHNRIWGIVPIDAPIAGWPLSRY